MEMDKRKWWFHLLSNGSYWLMGEQGHNLDGSPCKECIQVIPESRALAAEARVAELEQEIASEIGAHEETIKGRNNIFEAYDKQLAERDATIKEMREWILGSNHRVECPNFGYGIHKLEDCTCGRSKLIGKDGAE